MIPLVHGPREFGTRRTTIKDICDAAISRIDEHWNVRDPSRRRAESHRSDEDDEDMDNEDMDNDGDSGMEDDHDISGSISEEPAFVRCCKAQVQEWKNNVTKELLLVCF